MRLEVPAITRALRLADYAPELGEAVLHVWVNPPARLLNEHERLRGESRALGDQIMALTAAEAQARAAEFSERLERLGCEMCALYAQLWSRHPDPATHWTVEDVIELRASDTDPALFGWLSSRTVELVNEHRSRARKN